MLVEIDRQIQTELVNAAIKKAGSERKLEALTGIPDGSMYAYKNSKYRIPYPRFKTLLAFLGLNETDFEFKLVDHNYFRKKGGMAVQQKYRDENIFEGLHRKMRRGSSNYMKNWHAKMKSENPSEYFDLQHERFKSASQYKFTTNKCHKVRNQLELEVANALYAIPVDYEYEPLIKISSTTFFPDFKIGNLLIECTYWRGEQKALALADKIKKYEGAGFTVKVIIPDKLRCFYKCIENHILSPNGLKLLF